MVFTNGVFTLGDEGEIKTYDFFRDMLDLPKFIDKILDNCDDNLFVFHTGDVYRYFEKFEQVSRSKHVRGDDDLIINWNTKGNLLYT